MQVSTRTVRTLLLVIGAAIVALAGVRIAGVVLTGYVAHPAHRSRLAWLGWGGMAAEAAVLAVGGVVAWRVLHQGRETETRRVRREHLAEVGVLASGLAHEIRNYLNAMRTHLALLRKSAESDGAGRPSGEKRIARLEETIGGLEELVTEFLTFARPQADRLEEIGLRELIGEVADFVGLDLEQAGVELHVDVAPDLAPVWADRAKLKRAVLNLLVNARQAMPDGGTLRVRATPQPDAVLIEIADTGCGIPPEDQPRLFDLFFSTKAEGTGLGLAIVKRTVEDLSGSIAFESAVGQGTTFRMLLPSSACAKKQLANAAETTGRPRPQGPTPGSSP